MGLSEAGQGGVEPSALLLVGTELLQQLTHLLFAHVQQALQGHLSWTHLLQEKRPPLARQGQTWSLELSSYLRDLLPHVDDAEPVAEAREVLQLSAALL